MKSSVKKAPKITQADRKRSREAWAKVSRMLDHKRPVFFFMMPGVPNAPHSELTFEPGEPLPTKEQLDKQSKANPHGIPLEVILPPGEWSAAIDWEAGTIDLHGLCFREVE